MIEINALWILSLSVLLFSFFVSIFIAYFLFNQIDEEKGIFKRIFPFEVINNLPRGFSVYKILLFIFAGLTFSPLFLFGELDSYFVGLKTLAIITASIFGLAGICYVFLHFFNPSNVKVHLILVCIFSMMTCLSGSLVFILSLLAWNSGFVKVPNLIFGILSLLFALFEIANIFTFKLKDWAKLENEDGKLKRPKFFPLAAYEWASVLILVLQEASFFLVLLKY